MTVTKTPLCPQWTGFSALCCPALCCVGGCGVPVLAASPRGILRTNLPPSTPLKPQQPGREGGAWGKLPDALFGLFLKLSVHGGAPELAVPRWSGAARRPCLLLHCPSQGKTPLPRGLVLLELYLPGPGTLPRCPWGQGCGAGSPGCVGCTHCVSTGTPCVQLCALGIPLPVLPWHGWQSSLKGHSGQPGTVSVVSCGLP